MDGLQHALMNILIDDIEKGFVRVILLPKFPEPTIMKIGVGGITDDALDSVGKNSNAFAIGYSGYSGYSGCAGETVPHRRTLSSPTRFTP